MQELLDSKQFVVDPVKRGLGQENRPFSPYELSADKLGNPDEASQQYDDFMSELNADEAISQLRDENQVGTRKAVVLPENYDPETSNQILSEFEGLDDDDAEQLIENDEINKAVEAKLKQIEVANYENQLRVDELTKTAIETNNVLNYILWLLETLNIDIESIGDLVEEYKSLIVVLRRRKAATESKDVGVDTDGLVSQNEMGVDTSDLEDEELAELLNDNKRQLAEYIEKYEALLTKYKDLVKIMNEHEMNDLDLDLLQDILVRNKYSSQLILNNLTGSVEKLKDVTAEGLPTTSGERNEDLQGSFNDKIFSSIYFVKKMAEQLNRSESELLAQYPILNLQNTNETNLENERENILSIIEGLKLAIEVLNDTSNADHQDLVSNLGGLTIEQAIQQIQSVIQELNVLAFNRQLPQTNSPMLGGSSINDKLGNLKGGATIKEERKKIGRKLVLEKLLADTTDEDTMDKRIASYSMNESKSSDFIKLKLKSETIAKLLEITLKDFTGLSNYNELEKIISDNNDEQLLKIWQSRSRTVKKFVELCEELSNQELEGDDELVALINKIGEIDNSQELESAKAYMPIISNLLKEKANVKILAKQATPETVKYITFVMKLSSSVRNYIINKKGKKTYNKMVELSQQPELDEYHDAQKLKTELERARKAVEALVLDTKITSNRSTSDMITGKPVQPAETLGKITPTFMETLNETPRPSAPNNTPRKRGAFATTRKESLPIPKVSPPKLTLVAQKLQDIDVSKLANVVSNNLPKVKLDELKAKRSEILGNADPPKQKAENLIKQVAVKALEELPDDKPAGVYPNQESRKLAQIVDSDEWSGIEDDFGFEVDGIAKFTNILLTNKEDTPDSVGTMDSVSLSSPRDQAPIEPMSNDMSPVSVDSPIGTPFSAKNTLNNMLTKPKPQPKPKTPTKPKTQTKPKGVFNKLFGKGGGNKKRTIKKR